MFHNFLKFVLAALALWIAVASGAQLPKGYKTRNQTGRQPVQGGYDPAAGCVPNTPTAMNPDCWDALGMRDYIGDWWTANGPSCGDLGFAQCFLKQNNYPGLTCDLITDDTCGPPDTARKWDDPRVFYTLWNIYAVHQYFSQYYQAITNAQASALGKVGDIVLTVNPPREAKVDGKLASIIIAMSFGMFGVAKETLGGQAQKMIFVAVSALAGGSSQLLNYMTMENTNNYEEETIQIAEAQSKLSDMILDYQQGIATLIKSVQGDWIKFIVLCGTGAFTQRMTGSLPEQQSNILDQLTQYILGAALTANNMIVNVSPNTNVMSVAASYKYNSHVNVLSCPSFDKYGACGPFWYDASTDTTYSLENTKSLDFNHGSDMIHTMWDKGWVTPAGLFAGRTDCDKKAPYLDDNGVPQCAGVTVTRCIAANQEFDVQKALRTPPANVQEFTNCPNTDKFGYIYAVGSRVGRVTRMYMPCSYLGPALNQGSVLLGGFDKCNW